MSKYSHKSMLQITDLIDETSQPSELNHSDLQSIHGGIQPDTVIVIVFDDGTIVIIVC